MLVLAGMAALFFGSRVILHDMWHNDQDRAAFQVEPWMTARFVGMRMGMPPEMLFDMLEVTGPEARRMTLAEIAQRDGIPMEVLSRLLRDAAMQAEAARETRRPAPQGQRP